MSLPGLFGTAIGQDAQGDGGGEGGDPSRLPVKDKDLTAPPGSPSVGDRYIVASVATGAWAGHEDDIAEWAGAAWTFETPNIGWITYVEDEMEYYSWNGTAWVQESMGPHAPTHKGGGSDEIAAATVSVNGLMSGFDKNKLDEIPRLSEYLVGAVGEAPYQSIQAAITQAVADGHGSGNVGFIPIMDGVYTENLAFADGIYLEAARRRATGPRSARGSYVEIVGNHSLNVTAGEVRGLDIKFTGVAGAALFTFLGGSGQKKQIFYGCHVRSFSGQDLVAFGSGTPEYASFYDCYVVPVNGKLGSGGTFPIIELFNCNTIRSGGGDLYTLSAGALSVQGSRGPDDDFNGRIQVTGSGILVLMGIRMTASAENVQVDAAVGGGSYFQSCVDDSGEPITIAGAQASTFKELPASASSGNVWRFDGDQWHPVALAHADIATVTSDQHHAQLHNAAHKDGGGDEVATVAAASGAIPKADGSGKLPIGFMPDAVVGGVSYQGTWNAATNTPTLASGVGTKGHYYVVSTPGSTNLDGITDWKANDWAIYNGTAWEKIDNTDQVTSVFGRTGAVAAASADYTHAQIGSVGVDDHHAQIHAASHEDGGADEISVAGLSGTLVDPQTPSVHKTTHQNGGADEINVGGLSGTLADSQTPSAHDTSHEDGGSDEISVAGLSGALADTQTPSAHATSHKDDGSDELDVEELASAGAADAIATSDGAGAVSMVPHDPVIWFDAARLDSPDGTSDVPGSMVAAPIGADNIASNIPVRIFDDIAETGVLLKSTSHVPSGAANMSLHIAGHATGSAGGAIVIMLYTRKHNAGSARGAWSVGAVATFTIPANTYDVITSVTKTIAAWGLSAGDEFQILVSRDPLHASDTLPDEFALREIGLRTY